jgi:hypothetical protein
MLLLLLLLLLLTQHHIISTDAPAPLRRRMPAALLHAPLGSQQQLP